VRLALLVNDAAGAGAHGPAAPDALAAALRARGAAVDVHDVREVCGPDGDPSGVLASGPERVVVAGGDGSVGAAADLAARLGVLLAVVPTGTANDFARALGVPLDLDAAVALAGRPDPARRPVDVARAGDRPFVNAASAGLSVLAARHAHDLKPRLGPVAYAVGALRAGITARPVGVRVRVDGEEAFAGDAWQVIVAGTGAFGGGAELEVADEADRRLDVAVLRAGPRAELVRRAWGMRRGGLADQRGVLHRRGRVIEVDGPPTFNVDGEVLRLAPARFAIDGTVVEVAVP
jgi:diacylglycerol kinase family enzyme